MLLSKLKDYNHSAYVYIKAKPGAIFLIPCGIDLPIKTCKKYDVTLDVSVCESLQIQIVTVQKWWRGVI